MKLSVRQCESTKSADGGSCSPRIPCDGVFWSDGTFTGGCGEPCSFVTDRALTPDECLSAAWTYCAPNRLKLTEPSSFARGFWPDIARVAMAMYAQQTDKPELDFRPTMCERGSAPEPRIVKKPSKLGLDLGKLEINL